MQMSQDMFDAMMKHHDEYFKNHGLVHSFKNEQAWEQHLTKAWLFDWREQWGILRTVRNSIGITEAFHQFRNYQKI